MKTPNTYEVKAQVGVALNVPEIKAFTDPANTGEKRISVLKYNEEPPFEPVSEVWTRIVVMDSVDVFLARDYEDRTIPVDIYIRCDTMEPNDPGVEFDGNLKLQRLQSVIFEVLNAKLFELQRARMVMPLMRVRRPVTTHRSSQGFLYNGSIFKTFLGSYESD